MNFEEALKTRYYAQSFSGTPLHLLAAATSGFFMQEVNLGYTSFLFTFKKGYGTMYYVVEDLERMAKILEDRLNQDKDYFHKIKQIYDKHTNDASKIIQKIEELDLSTAGNNELILFLRQLVNAIQVAVGVGHLIEPFSLTNDIRIKMMLQKYIKNPKELNKIITILMAPTKKSFVNEYEASLHEIFKQTNEAIKKEMIKKHIKDFFWIRNGYAGRYNLTEEVVHSELRSEYKEPDFEKLLQEKKSIIENLKLDHEIIMKIEATEFLTYWQDERKKNVLIAIDYTDRILEEFAKRLDVELDVLRYLTLDDLELSKIESKEFHEILKERRQGVLILSQGIHSQVLVGKDYGDFMQKLEKEQMSEIKELTGMTASVGTAIGKVKVLTTVESMKNLEEGDILVASMTRPELVPAMKKAAAVITDEGGITCHAAIISRELGIPCIIGTKIATKVLNDGDLVEIKGNHGLIIILEKAK